MGIEFDPRWEYREDNPEITEDMPVTFAWGLNKEGYALLNGYGDRYQAPHVDKEDDRIEKTLFREYGWRICQRRGCGMPFKERGWNGYEQRFCSIRCIPRTGENKKLPQRIRCSRWGCSKWFHPKNSKNIFCCLSCAAIGRTNKQVSPYTHLIPTILQMIEQGRSMASISRELGISVKAITKLRQGTKIQRTKVRVMTAPNPH